MWLVLGLCWIGVLVSIRVFSQVGLGFLLFFLISFRLGLCVLGYLTTISEKNSISLWILELGICRSWRSLTFVVCTVPFIHALIIMGGSTIHPSWDRGGVENNMFIKFLVGALKENRLSTTLLTTANYVITDYND